MQRRVPVLVVVSCLLAASCGSKAPRSEATTTATALTAQSVATLATLATMSTAGPTAALTPHVVCYESINGIGEIEPQTDGFYFGYDNSGSTPVVLPEGAQNRLAATSTEDHPLVPTVFAPGTVPVAFLAVVDTAEVLPSWTLTGPDGETRTAQVTGDEPECTPELLTPPAPDPRSARLEFGFRGLPEGSAPTEVEITATLVGLPALSVCPPGLDPRAPVVEISDSTTSQPGSVATFTYPVGTITTSDITEVAGVGGHFAVRVIDECTSGDAVLRSWPVNPELAGLLEGVSVCAEVQGEAVGPVGCAVLGLTGGVRIYR